AIDFAIARIKKLAAKNPNGVYARINERMNEYSGGGRKYLLDSYRTWLLRSGKKFSPKDFGSKKEAGEKNLRYGAINSSMEAAFRAEGMNSRQISEFRKKVSDAGPQILLANQ
ncbi:MAG: hypothetical protein V1822_00520, partial [Candidatus Micrarchaeota archaeon]